MGQPLSDDAVDIANWFLNVAARRWWTGVRNKGQPNESVVRDRIEASSTPFRMTITTCTTMTGRPLSFEALAPGVVRARGNPPMPSIVWIDGTWYDAAAVVSDSTPRPPPVCDGVFEGIRA